MHRYINIVVFLALFAVFSGCAVINPNNNVGMTTVDYLVNNGECKAALEKARPHAKKGEPWAQYRMGIIPIDRQCKDMKKPTPEEYGQMLGWLTKASCYESKTKWERGDPLSIGESGYYDTRASSTNAAISLSELYARHNMIGASWWWINHVMKQYDKSDTEYANLEKQLKKYESLFEPEDLAKVKSSNDNLCAGKR
jgi:hypothetical protein